MYTETHVRVLAPFWAHCHVALQGAGQIAARSCKPLAAVKQAPVVAIPHDGAWH